MAKVQKREEPVVEEAPRVESASEVHAMVSRTHNAVVTLAASLKEVVERQDRYERGLNLNSFVAYVLFTVLLGGGFFLLYRSRADSIGDERDAAIRLREEAEARTIEIEKRLAARDEAQKKAEDFWRLLETGQRAEAIGRYADVARSPLTAVEAQVFEQGVKRARAELVDLSFAEGVEAFKAQQWKRATTSFKRALSFEETGPRAVQMRYYQGVSLVKQGDYAEALRHLEQAVEGGVDRNMAFADARFYLANALEMLKQDDRAKGEYERFANGHWGHPLTMTALKRARAIGMKGRAEAAAAAPPAPAPPPRAPAPATPASQKPAAPR